MKQRLLLPMLVALVGFCSPAAAQTPAPPPLPAVETAALVQDAEVVRNQLQNILRGYPRTVGEVLRRDPSLLARADYMTAYPQLAAFLAQHPEVQRNVEFYFEGYGSWGDGSTTLEYEALGVLLAGMAIFFGIAAFLGILTWLVRAIIQHRRWLKASQVQADMHTKLMERMATNEELLAYVQSPAGRRFLEAAPIRPEVDATGSAPIGSIVWSMMAGIVLATLGLGFRLAGSYIGSEAQQAFIVVGVIVLALGLGFIFASLMAYLVSSRLGLFPAKAASESQSNA